MAAAAGCRVVWTENRRGARRARLLHCRDHGAKVRFLTMLAEHGGSDPAVRRTAEAIAATCASEWETIVELHRLVRDGVRNVGEAVETFSPADRTLRLGLGDCDDQAIALMALLRSLGMRAGVAVLPPPSTGRPPTHVAATVFYGGRWHWLETTIAAEPGEHPLAAARRLGVTARPDLEGR